MPKEPVRRYFIVDKINFEDDKINFIADKINFIVLAIMPNGLNICAISAERQWGGNEKRTGFPPCTAEVPSFLRL